MTSFRQAFFLLSLATTTAAWTPQLFQSTTSTCRSTTRLGASGSNVVLSPSDDPAAFDSLKIGSAKVHRYSLDTDPDGATEYVMWYHGRFVCLFSNSHTVAVLGLLKTSPSLTHHFIPIFFLDPPKWMPTKPCPH